jgi:hypothetical protein
MNKKKAQFEDMIGPRHMQDQSSNINPTTDTESLVQPPASSRGTESSSLSALTLNDLTWQCNYHYCGCLVEVAGLHQADFDGICIRADHLPAFAQYLLTLAVVGEVTPLPFIRWNR